jgi:hypothetical protein
VRSPVIHLDHEIKLKKPSLPEGEHDFLPLLQKVYQMSIESVYLSIGEWGAIYLTLHNYIIQVLLSYAFISIPVLITIYLLGSSDVDEKSSKLGISHVIENEDYLIAPIIFIFVLTFFISFLVFYFYRKVTCESFQEMQTQLNVVKITNIPKNFPPHFINYKIKKLMMSQYDENVQGIYTIPNYETAYNRMLKVKSLQEKMKEYQFKLSSTGKRPMVLNKMLRKVDAIEYTQDRILATQDEVARAKDLGIFCNSGKAFVFCKTHKKAKKIIAMRFGNDEIINTDLLNFEIASSPEDVIWKNVGVNLNFSTTSRILYNLLFVFLFLMILTPTTFNYLIISLVESIGGGTLLKGIIGVYLPSLLLLVYQQVVLPEAVEFLVARENHSYKHDEISSGLRKYLFYLVFYIFLYPLLGLRFIEFVKIFFDSSVDWEEEFANSVNETGQFFTVFLIHECFIKNGWDLMVTGKYFKSKAKALIASNDEERALAFEAEDFKFDLELAISLNIFIIVCSFGVVYPLVIVPGLGFFGLRVRLIQYFVHKHNLLAVFYVNRNSSAFPVLFSILCSISIAMFSMQVLTGATLILSGVDDYLVIAKLIVPASFCQLVLCILYFNNLIAKGKVERVKESERLVQVDEREFYHPLDKDE